ncbi:DNA-binding response regulator, OmpR family, contains REC and winged-helix (wHTH) domain [Klenkia marina]|uniref:DNA-binding response regulator, OmpR family, contains REC and winged-helix (WHTH) domain n=1 Tax=Klenkia marina TaxID=1960309 RepID=A0A1G4XPJ2_9ACTN|nr:response regulator transcription factor [Klenkia marina]SCX43142.1 DNA-binding response regulator, OmpR family, contains REC and winged-helix (wHTH) domain [Klenkia marina]
MTRGSVLVVEDVPEVRALVSTTLAGVGLGVRAVGTARECLAEVGAVQPDVIVLDRGLPDADGTELCRELRSRTHAYVLMVSTHADEVDVLVGLAAGADGYMAVPFSPRELAARVQAFLRRPVTGPVTSPTPAVPGATVADRVTVRVPSARTVLADLEVDDGAREVRVRGEVVPLTRTEFDLLHALASRPGRVLQRRTLLREVWGSDWEGHLRLVEAHMSNLRRKLAAAGLEQPPIRTVRGVGYRLAA